MGFIWKFMGFEIIDTGDAWWGFGQVIAVWPAEPAETWWIVGLGLVAIFADVLNYWLYSRVFRVFHSYLVVTQNHVLVGGLEHFLFSHMLGIIIPTDELIFFKGIGQPPTSQFYVAATMAYRIRNHPMNRPWGSYRISTHELRVYHFFEPQTWGF